MVLLSVPIDAIFQGLIYLCLIVLVIWVALWVIGHLGIALPPNVINIVWVIVALFVIWWIVRTLLPGLGMRF